MKIYKDLDVLFKTENDAQLFIDKIINYKTEHFSYSEEYSKNGQPGIIQILSTRLTDIPDSRIIINRYYSKVSVINIVPLPPVNQLSKDQYNTIVDVFDAEVLYLLYNSMDSEVHKSKNYIDIREKMPKTFNLLESWASLANTNNPFVHPCDAERWNKFICDNVLSGESTSSDLIESFVGEELNWDADLRNDVAIRYEQDRDLIKYYINNYR